MRFFEKAVLFLVCLIALKGTFVTTDAMFVRGKEYSAWLSELASKVPEPESDVARAIKEAGANGLETIRQCLHPSGISSSEGKGSKNFDPKERMRIGAMRAVVILGNDASALRDYLIQILNGRKWKGREYAAYSLMYIAPDSQEAFKIAMADIKSSDSETRVQGIIMIRYNKSPEAQKAILNRTNDKKERVRDFAIFSLRAFLPAVEIVEALESIKGDSNRSELERSRAALGLDPELLKHVTTIDLSTIKNVKQ
jgi:hypothetical protein